MNDRTAGDDAIKEARLLLVGAGVELHTGSRRLDLGLRIEAPGPQAAGVALPLGGQQEDVARLEVALLQAQDPLPGGGHRGVATTGLLWQKLEILCNYIVSTM